MAAKNKRQVSMQAVGKPMRRPRGPLGEVWGFIVWLVGILVSLAVGFGMTDQTLTVPFIPPIVMQIAGWIVVVLTILGVILKLIDKASI